MIFASASAELWTPANMTTLAWYDADDATTITESSGAVSQWDDKSGNARHISQLSAGLKPTYTTGQIAFDGTNDYLFNTSPFMYANGEINIFIVCSVFADTDKRIISEGSSTDGDPIYAVQTINPVGDKLSARIRNDSGTNLSTGVALSSASAFDDTKKLYQWGDNGSQLSGRVNSDDLQTSAYTRSGTLTLDRFSVGALLRSSSASHANIDVNEIVITSNLVDSSREIVEGYLAHKWGIEASLQSGHPYKSSAPTV